MAVRLLPMIAGGVIGFLPCLVEAACAQQTLVAYVSGSGVDSGICDSPSSPCRTFQYALEHVSDFGEIKTLDPANYGPVTIDRAVSITGVDGAGIYLSSPSVGILIQRGAAPVRLTRLTIDGDGNLGGQRGDSGIVINGPGPITIADCVIRSFVDIGIDIRDATPGLLITNTLVAANRGGINLGAGTDGSSIAVLDRVRLEGNATIGLAVTEQSTATVIDTVVTGGQIGIAVEGNGWVWLARSIVTGNFQYGIQVLGSPAGIGSFGNNDISGNGQDIYGQLSHVSTQ
jgi:hypothetical protein